MSLDHVSADETRSIAVVRALFLGDFLCATPALRALRRHFKSARISLVGLPWCGGFVERFRHLVDGFIAFPGFPGIAEQPFEPSDVAAFIDRCREERFDLVVQMHGSGAHINHLCLLMGGRRAAGYHPVGGWCPVPDWFLPYPEATHEIHRNLELVRLLGAESRGTWMEMPIFEADRGEASVLLGALEPNAPYVCVHPGAKSARCWPPERFARIADFAARRGLQVVVTGSADEIPLAERLVGAMEERAISLAGKTALGPLASVFAGARALVSHDTGVAHMAAALGTPGVVIYEGDAKRAWPPLDCPRNLFLADERGVSAERVEMALSALLRARGGECSRRHASAAVMGELQ